MNYIKRLESELTEARAELQGLRCGLDDLKSYLMSCKFEHDTRVQVRDVLHRLAGAEDLAASLLIGQIDINRRA